MTKVKTLTASKKDIEQARKDVASGRKRPSEAAMELLAKTRRREAAIKVTICGPNLRDQSKGDFHVHAAGCADLKRNLRREPEYAYGWTIEAESRRAVIENVYQDFIFANDRDPWTNFTGDLHFFPCVEDLPLTVQDLPARVSSRGSTNRSPKGSKSEGKATMPTIKRPKIKTGATAAKPKAAAKPAAKASNGSTKRTAADIDKLVPQFVKHLKGGGTMRALKTEHGFSDDGPIRQALARGGYDSKGAKLEMPTVTNTPKGVAAARKAGHAWYIIALALGKTEADVKAMAEKAGADVSGRVYVGGGRGK